VTALEKRMNFEKKPPSGGIPGEAEEEDPTRRRGTASGD